ncbi:SNF2-related protein, partial [Salmonella sp. ZJHZ20_0162]|uniref:SNF2-related protein n=1 Tax=Salmonella sp. ZJHZ20_0162 TaxID=3159595 RepID=UPI00397B57B9
EKRDDAQRLNHLNGRIRPFLLRRTKEQVASELPPKTEITQWVEMTQLQRDRYETLRLAMDQKVREEITRQGLARSHIVILE